MPTRHKGKVLKAQARLAFFDPPDYIKQHVTNKTNYATDLKKTIDRRRLVDVTGLKGSSLAFVLAELEGDLRGPVVIITADLREAELQAPELAFFCRRKVLVFPSYEVFPFSQLSPYQTTISRRIETLYRLATGGPELIVITPVEALLQRMMPKRVLTSFAEYVVAREDLDREGLMEKLVAGGYEATSLVQEVGDFSVRGGIIDIFPPMHENPIRIDSFGDWVESIREFDRLTQRSLREIDEFTLLPVRELIFGDEQTSHALDHIRPYALERGLQLEGIKEIEANIEQRVHFAGSEFLLPLFYPELSTLADYLTGAIVQVSVDPLAIEERPAGFEAKIGESYVLAGSEPRFCPEPQDLYLIDQGWETVLPAVARVRVRPLPAGMEEDQGEGSLHFATEGNIALRTEVGIRHQGEDYFAAVAQEIQCWMDKGESIYIICHSAGTAEQISGVLQGRRLSTRVTESPFCFASERSHGTVGIYVGDVSRGFRFPAYGIVVLTEDELLGEKTTRKPISLKRKIAPILDLGELASGDLVVHRDHGIGIYRNLVRLQVAETVNDYLLLEYRDGDKLYLPVYRLNVLQRYIGIEGSVPQIDKLGGKSWHLAKEKVKEAVWKVALELLDIYAHRQVEQGFAFSPPDALYKEFELSFPHEETPDQMAAIEETLRGMCSPKPMDRLICGDVGFGKTEVAIRAAMKAVVDGRQVAVLVPTTVLAEQHLKTFTERFASFPIVVACLSRFRTPREQKEILAKLSAGKVDIVIGTHRLLQKDIQFHNLGLIVIDEEHRFGVRHKECLRQIRKTVDVLTLTATPIPRTLQMSLLNVRDLSVIDTPPQDRLAVKTYVTRLDDNVLKEAILREHERGGQVFFVHNRVASINAIAARLHKIVPSLRIAVAHGQLSSKALEEVMVQFVRREIDVLVCTTIIESGLDIPSANTIIINRADLLGLAEIHQLRGRVGRSNQQAYAYLLVPSTTHLSRDSQKRLEALLDFSELGGGFKLAMSDLQIRGGGNILGTNQTGHIAAVGYDLYLDLLEKTVNELKGLPAEEDFEPEINLEMSAYIPDDYVPEPEQRFSMYRRLTAAYNPAAMTDIENELIDRYGPIPAQAKALLALIDIKQDLKRLGIRRLDGTSSHFALSFSQTGKVSPEAIMTVIKAGKGRYRFSPDHKLCGILSDEGTREILHEIKKVLQALLQHAKVQV